LSFSCLNDAHKDKALKNYFKENTYLQSLQDESRQYFPGDTPENPIQKVMRMAFLTHVEALPDF
jgi:hypothetical protein